MNNNPALRKKSVYISIEKLIGTIAGQLYLLTDSSNWAFIFECMQHVNKILLKLNTSNIDGWEYFYIREGELYNLAKYLVIEYIDKLNIDLDCLAQNVCYEYGLEDKLDSFECNSLCIHYNDDGFDDCQQCRRNQQVIDYYTCENRRYDIIDSDKEIFCEYHCIKNSDIHCCKSCQILEKCNVACLNVDEYKKCEYSHVKLSSDE